MPRPICPPSARKAETLKVCFDARAADVALLDARAAQRQVSRADVIREALRLYLAGQPPDPPPAAP
jgi:hypothetical protein